jgi:hypothetical protein
MVPIQVVLIVGGITLAAWGVTSAVHGVKHVAHAISAKIYHKKVIPAIAPTR